MTAAMKLKVYEVIWAAVWFHFFINHVFKRWDLTQMDGIGRVMAKQYLVDKQKFWVCYPYHSPCQGVQADTRDSCLAS